MKKAFAIAVAAFVSLLMVSTAQAANEEPVAKTTIKPQLKSLFKKTATPVDLTIRADVDSPATEVKIMPMKNTLIKFPKGINFNPKPNMPVCTDAKLNAQSALGDPAAVVNDCKDSVVGTGTSTILLFQSKAAALDDPILVIFNAGKSANGNPKIKIYGYSQGTTVGILMTGELKNGVLDVAIPVLSYDSSVKYYQFDIPGKTLNRPELNVKAKGLDQTYVTATCPTGVLKTDGEFTFGTRDPGTGQDTSPEYTISSPETTQNCKGLPGKPSAKLSLKVKGPAKVKSGKKGTFKVTLKNTGVLDATGVKVTSTGGGKASAGTIKAGKSKTVNVKAKVSGRKGAKKTLVFKAKGKGVSAKATAKVTVK